MMSAGKYEHRPAPTGLHAKLLRELSAERSMRYIVRPHFNGLPNHIIVSRITKGVYPIVWRGWRGSMPARYRGAADPFRCLTAPDSSD